MAYLHFNGTYCSNPKPKPRKSKKAVIKCLHCGKACTDNEDKVCNKCYSKYTPGMLADLET